MPSRYITWEDVVDRHSSLAKVEGISSSYVPTAEDWTDGMLAPQYTIPFSNTPAVAPNMVKDIAIDVCFLMSGRGKTEGRRGIAESIDAQIKKIFTGHAEIISGSGTIIERSGRKGYSSTESYHSVFGLLAHEDLVFDKEQVEADYDKRDLDWPWT